MSPAQSKIFAKYFRSFFLLSLVFVLIFLAVNVYLIFNNVTKTLQASYASSLQQITAYANANINDMKSLAVIIASDSDFTSYNIMKNSNTPGNIVKELGNVKRPFTLLSSASIIYRNSPYTDINYTLYSNDGRFSIAEYCTVIGQGLLDPNQLRQQIETLTDPVFVPLSDAGQQLIYLIPLPVNFISSPGVLLFQVDQATFIPDYIAAEINITVVDQQNQILAYRGRQAVYSGPDGQFETDNLDDQIVLTSMIENQRLTIYLSVDKTRFYQPLANSIYASLGLQFMVFAIGIFLSYILARQNYLPIQLLLSKFKSANSPSTSGKINELEFLDQNFERLREERDRLKVEMLEENLLVRNHLINAVLYQNCPPADSEFAAHFWHDFAISGCEYCTVMIMIDQYMNLANKYSAKELMAIKKSICDTLESDSQNIDRAYALDAEGIDSMVAIVRGKVSENVELSAFVACQQLRKTVQDNFKLTITCSIGNAVGDIAELGRSYRESAKYARFRFFIGSDTIITSDLVQNFESRNRYLSAENSQAIDNLIKVIQVGSTADIQPMVGKIFTDATSKMQIDVFNNLYFIILSRVNLLVRDSMPDLSESFSNKLDLLYENRFETAAETISTLIYFCSELARKIQSLDSSPADKNLYNQIMAFIEHHSNDKNLNLTMIADQFDLNPSYLTRYFKNCCGIPLMQYIDQFRFKRSKELLAQPNLSIRDVLEKVGYVDEANYIRKFKKIEGISTTQYRKIYGNRVNDH